MVIELQPIQTEKLIPVTTERPYLLDQPEIEQLEDSKTIVVIRAFDSETGFSLPHSWIEVGEILKPRPDLIDGYYYEPYEEITTFFSREEVRTRRIDKQIRPWGIRSDFAQMLSIRYIRKLFAKEQSLLNAAHTHNPLTL